MANDSFSSVGIEDDLELSGIWGESDMSVDQSLNESSVSVSSDAFHSSTSTPTKKKENATFKRPPAVPKHFAQCTRAGCLKKYKTQNGFNNHMQDHRLKDIAKKVGGIEDLISYLRKDMINIIDSMVTKTKCTSVLEILTKVKENSTSEEWMAFFDGLLLIVEKAAKGEGSKVIMPMALRSNLQKSLNRSLSDKALTDGLFDKLNLVTPCDMTVFSLFLFDFLWDLVDRSVLYVCQSMMQQLPAPRHNVGLLQGDASHIITHQVLHHVAGFALYHHIRHANKYQNNLKLQRMKECILTQFVQSGSPPELDTHDKAYWTHILNRKSLLFVDDKAFPFFVQLGNLLLISEEKDGSLLWEKVLTSVMQNPNLLALWDCIVNNTLEETESIDLLMKIVRVISRTYGRGNMLKKMNIISNSTKANKSTLSISHRASLL